MTTRNEIKEWCERGVVVGSTHLIVVCDTYDHDDYPVWVGDETPSGLHAGEPFYDVFDHFNGHNMQIIMEVYDLSLPLEDQLNEHRARHEPPRPAA